MNFLRVTLVALSCLGCGTAVPPNHGHHPDEDAGSGLEVDAGVVDAGSADAGGADAGLPLPGVPVLVSVALVSHSMSIAWQLPASGCSSVSLKMKAAGGSYGAVRTLSGVTTSTQYSPGHGSGTFCFQVSCTLNGLESVPSNELCAAQ
jgi:hypothetical protein